MRSPRQLGIRHPGGGGTAVLVQNSGRKKGVPGGSQGTNGGLNTIFMVFRPPKISIGTHRNPFPTHFHQYLWSFFKKFSPAAKKQWCKKVRSPRPLGIRDPRGLEKGGGTCRLPQRCDPRGNPGPVSTLSVPQANTQEPGRRFCIISIESFVFSN